MATKKGASVVKTASTVTTAEAAGKETSEAVEALTKREQELNEREASLNDREEELENRSQELSEKETLLGNKEQELNEINEGLDLKKEALKNKETALNEKEGALAVTENALSEKEEELSAKEKQTVEAVIPAELDGKVRIALIDNSPVNPLESPKGLYMPKMVNKGGKRYAEYEVDTKYAQFLLLTYPKRFALLSPDELHCSTYNSNLANINKIITAKVADDGLWKDVEEA